MSFYKYFSQIEVFLFHLYLFRGRVVVEFGEPIRIDKALFQQYKESKRNAYQTLLTQVSLRID